MKINLNQRVQVQLTEKGKESYKTYLESLFIHKKYWPEQFNIVETELWQIMEIFGRDCFLGSKNLFVNNELEIL